MIIDLHTLDRIIGRAEKNVLAEDGLFKDVNKENPFREVTQAAIFLAYNELRKSIAEELETISAQKEH